MAKWGEGDPRWIVEERPDATNVNNWHWSEKNATPWSKDKLTALLDGLTFEHSDFSCKVTEIDKMDGEATANNRKGKLILFYEWNIVLKWTGLSSTSTEPCEGKVTIPNLSEENDLDDIDITITVNSSNSDSERLKEFMYINARGKIRDLLGVYIKDLKEEFAKGLILPRKDEAPQQKTANTNSTVKSIKSGFNTSTPDSDKPKSTTPASGNNLGCKLDVQEISIKERFQCRAGDLYDAFTKPELVSAFTRSNVKMEPNRGGGFNLFDGNITGKFEELKPGEKIIQSWRYKLWPDGHYSQVTLEFQQKDDHTELSVTQKSVPSSEVETTIRNWHRYYFNSIKQTFGFGSFLY